MNRKTDQKFKYCDSSKYWCLYCFFL